MQENLICLAAGAAAGALAVYYLGREKTLFVPAGSPGFESKPPHPEWKPGDKQPIPYPGEHEVLYPAELKSAYFLMISAYVPRPIALVSSLSSAGQGNVAPYSYSGCVAHDPPTLVVSCCRRPDGSIKDTCANVLATKQFVVNVMSDWAVEAENYTCGNFAPDQDEMKEAGLTPLPSLKVKPARVGESAINFECELVKTHDIVNAAGKVTATVLFGEVVAIHVHQGVLLRDGAGAGKPTVDVNRLRPLGRLGGNTYTRVGSTFDLPRPDRAAAAAGK